jgi:hypothetical protein
MNSKSISKLDSLSQMINSIQPTFLQATFSGSNSQSLRKVLEASVQGTVLDIFDWFRDLHILEVVYFLITLDI